MRDILLVASALASFACFLVLTWLAHRRVRHLAVVIIASLIYLYTFHGFVVSLLMRAGFIEFDPMFYQGAPYDIAINQQFWLAVILQAVFANSYMLTFGAIGAPSTSNRLPEQETITHYHTAPLLVTAGLALAIGGAMWLDALRTAISSQQPLYLFFKAGGDLGVWYPVSRVLFDIAAMGAGGAVGLLVAQQDARMLLPRVRGVALWITAIAVAAAVATVMGFLGDRATLLGGFTFGLLLASHRRFPLTRLLPLGLVSLGMINIIAVLREGGRVFNREGPSVVNGLLGGILLTHESTITFSTYSVLRIGVPSSHGQSVLFLIEALVPRFIRPVRVSQDAFEYYANATGLPPLRGWGIHFATDAYINFGLLGVVVTAICLATFHGILLRKSRTQLKWLFCFAGCIASFPIGFRAGIPGFKTLTMGALIGWLLGWLAHAGFLHDRRVRVS